MTMSLKEFLHSFMEEAGTSNDDIRTLDEASSHPYECRCNQCKSWWKMVGPDPDIGGYGPFSDEEIEEG